MNRIDAHLSDDLSQQSLPQKLTYFVIQLLTQRTITLLAILFVAGLAGAFFNMSRLSSNLIESQAIQSSAREHPTYGASINTRG